MSTADKIRYFANFEGLQWRIGPNGCEWRDPEEWDDWMPTDYWTLERLTDPTFQAFDGCTETDETFKPLHGGKHSPPQIFVP